MIRSLLLVLFSVVISTQAFSQDKIVADLKVQGNKKLKSSFIKKVSKINPKNGFTIFIHLNFNDLKL